MKKVECIYCKEKYELTQEQIDNGESLNFCCEYCEDRYSESYGYLLEDY